MFDAIAFKSFMLGDKDTQAKGRLEELGLSVEKFALACGLTRSSVYYYLSGKMYPSSMTLLKMAVVLGVPADKLRELIPTREPGAPVTKVIA